MAYSNIDIEPFGPADGATAAGHFVFFADVGVWGDLSLAAKDTNPRILVGRRGSGKSRYLRQLEENARKTTLNYQQFDTTISITQLRWLHSTYPDRSERLEVWRGLWSCAIFSGLCSFLLNQHSTAGPFEDTDRGFLSGFCDEYLGASDTIFPIVGSLTILMNKNLDRSKLDDMLADPVWFKVRNIVEKALSVSKPVTAYIDILDENFAQSPAASIDAQLGLITFILMRLLDANAANRLYLCVTVRDVIYSSLLQLEHGQRYDKRQHIRRLDWSKEAARYFLERKIETLPADFKCKPKGGLPPVESWLGITSIINVARGNKEESVIDYILRHTRFLPRDIVEIGNALSIYIRRMKSQSREILAEDIRYLVSEEARRVSKRALETVFDHMIAIDKHDLLKPEDIKTYRENLEQGWAQGFLAQTRAERFDRKTLLDADDAFEQSSHGWAPEIQGIKVKFSDMLWQHGLLGYEQSAAGGTVVKYYHASGGSDGDVNLALPNETHYFLHSSFLDAGHFKIELIAPIVETVGIPS
jgi:hypothetical protein